MNASEFLERIKNSELLISDVLRFIFEGGFVTSNDFPDAFDSKGNTILRFDDKNRYNTFCPFHSGQENGDSLAVYNDQKNLYCYNGSCAYSQRPFNVIELIMATVFKLDHSTVFEFELAKDHFWKAARFLTEHFGDRFNVTLRDIQPKQGSKTNPTERVLEETMAYYHFLATGNDYYKKRLNTFLVETRHLNNGVVPVEKLIKEYKIGITPYSETGDRLYNYLLKKGFTKKQILDSNVCSETKGGVKDFFRNRAIIPYINRGKVIGMYGRDMSENGDKKYRHMRLEGEVRTPNGLDRILNKEEFHLVEGEFSKVAVNALGFVDDVMETRGVNGFRDEHVELIRKARARNSDICKRCYIAFDPDNAGADSVNKIGKKLIEIGVEVLVIRLPIIYEDDVAVYIDPNDLLEVYGKKAREKFIQMKKDAISFDAFIMLHELNKNRPKNFSEARMALRNLSVHLKGIHPLERVFILEEFLENLKTAINKDLLREYLKEIWIKDIEEEQCV